VEDKEILATLKPVYHEGSYVQPCMEGTRTGILQEIDVWLEDTKAANILWLSGSPGAGKSAIMSGLVSKLRTQRRLGASFFFRRGDVALSDPAMVWCTVAFDLAEFHPAMARSLVKNIRQRGVDPATTDIEPHFVGHGEFGSNSATADIESHFSYMIQETLTKKNAWKQNEDALKQQNDTLKRNEDALKENQEALKKNPDALENNHNALARSEDELRRKEKMNGMVSKERELASTRDLEVLKNILQMLKEGKRLLEVERSLSEKRKALLEERKSLMEKEKALLKERKSLTKHRDELKALRPVIILDALDECGRKTSQSYQRQAFIDTLMMWLRLPSAFKLIITSRDEPAPRSFRDACKQMELPTGLHTTPEAWDDIRRFLRTRFVNLSARFPSLSNWPGQTKIDQLTTCAAGVFIWAETVIRFVDNGGDAPDQQLDLVLGGLGKEGDTIDSLYRKILCVSFGDADNHTLVAFRAIVGAIVLAKVPLPRDDLASFLDISVSDTLTDLVLHKLSSVISIVGINKVLHVRHISFTEFLCDPTQCPSPFTIDPAAHSRNFVSACLRLIKQGLKDNICELWTSRLPDEDIPDLTDHTQKSVSFRLSYSCRFWAEHLRDTPSETPFRDHLLNEIKDFFDNHLFHWLQVMSLIKEGPAASAALVCTALWSEVSPCVSCYIP
jgi:hypothetical protein